MIPDLDVDAAIWWYVLAVSAAAATSAAGVAWAGWALLRGHRGHALAAALAATAGGIAGLVGAGIAAWDRFGGAFIEVDGHRLRDEVTFAAQLGAAALIGLAIALLAVAAFALGRRRWRSPAIVAVAPVVALVFVGLALLMAERESAARERGRDPEGTLPAARDLETTALIDDLVVGTGLAVAPDGEIVFTELRSPDIQTLTPGGGGPEVVASLPLDPAARVLHVAVHPQWPAERVLYVTADLFEGDVRTVSIFRVALGEGEASIDVVAGGYPTGPSHPASALAICDGYLFVSIGDGDHGARQTNGNRVLAQVPDSLYGKILRYRLDGTDLEPAGLLAEDPPVYAMGLRNPFGMTCDPETGYPLVTENGFEGRDQVRLVAPRSNHEWPYTQERELLTPPLFTSGLRPIAPTGIVARPSGDGGSAEVMFASYLTSTVYTMTVDGAGEAGPPAVLHRTPEAPLALALGPDGCLYASGTALWRIAIEGCSPGP